MDQRDQGTFRERIARNRRNSLLLIAAFLAFVVSGVGMMNIYVGKRTRAEAQITVRNAVFIQQSGWLNSIPFDTLDKLYPVPTFGTSQTWVSVLAAQGFYYRRTLTVLNGNVNAPAPIFRRTVTLTITPSLADGTPDTAYARSAISQWDRWQTYNPLNLP